MKQASFFLFLFIFGVICCGCQTSRPTVLKNIDPEAQESLGKVAGALSGKNLTQEEMKNLAVQIQNDKDAQSAVETISQSMDKAHPMQVKYCPKCGHRFSMKVGECPDDHVPLKVLEK